MEASIKKKVFNKADVNNDGKLDESEMSEHLDGWTCVRG